MLFSWHIIMRMKAPKEGSCDPIAPLELPHAMHAFNRVSATDKLNLVSFVFIFHFNFWCPCMIIWMFLIISFTFERVRHSMYADQWIIVCSQDGYHTYRGGFWNYFSMGKKIKLVLNLVGRKCIMKNSTAHFGKSSFFWVAESIIFFKAVILECPARVWHKMCMFLM